MTIQGTIQNYSTGERVPGASITVVDKSGRYQGEGIAANQAGEFSFTSDKLAGNWLQISSVGYKPVLIESSLLAASPPRVIDLWPEMDELDAVTVTPGALKPWWILLVIGAIWVLSKKN